MRRAPKTEATAPLVVTTGAISRGRVLDGVRSVARVKRGLRPKRGGHRLGLTDGRGAVSGEVGGETTSTAICSTKAENAIALTAILLVIAFTHRSPDGIAGKRRALLPCLANSRCVGQRPSGSPTTVLFYGENGVVTTNRY